MENLFADRDYRVASGCAVMGIMNQGCGRFSGSNIIKAIEVMHERSSGLGGGFAAYGIYPDYADLYAFHIMFETEEGKNLTEEYLVREFIIERMEPIPTQNVESIDHCPFLWRYFVRTRSNWENEEDFVVKSVMHINSKIPDAFVFSSGKNMGIFKGVGFPEDIGRFYKLEEYQGWTWIAHGRFPTNSVWWWGGAHPFGLLDWAVVHNGEVSSYGINKRYLLNFGYECSLSTDTEIIAYLFDLLIRKHGLSFEIVSKILAAPFWTDIERMPKEEKIFYTNLRITYSSALLNGPFSIIVGNSNYMMGLTDRIKLRPLIAAIKGDFLYLSSEESAVREICPQPDKVWAPKAGEPVIGKLKI